MIRTGFPTDGPALGEVGEHEVIHAVTTAAPSTFNGDDAAVLTPAVPNSRVVVSTDMLVQGRHFTPELTTPFDVGKRAVVQNFADIEAMGAHPIAVMLAFSASPSLPLEVVRQLAAGIQDAVETYSCELVGGDVTSGEGLVISVSAVGSLGGSLPALSLDRARVGQRVIAHGHIGYSAAGLALLQSGKDIPENLHPLVHAFQTPELQPGRGMIARAAGATAMTDNSDGLIHDLSTMARRSKVQIDLDSSALEPDELQREAGRLLGIDPWEWILSGGEDHTLLGTTDAAEPVGFRTIGTVSKGAGVLVDAEEPAYGDGWESFS